MTSVYLGLGSNLGRRMRALRGAVRALDGLPGSRVARVSSAYRTSAVGPAQRDFLNAAVELRTSLRPQALLRRLKVLEKSLGRRARRRWGPREIDMDILLYGRRVLRRPGLTVPHARLAERKFVLAPLAEIAPRRIHPTKKRSMTRLLRELTDPSQRIRLFKPLLEDGRRA